MQLAHFKLQIALGLMKAAQAAEDVEEERDVSSTSLSNRASDIPGAVRYDCVNHIPVKIAQPNAQQNVTVQTKNPYAVQEMQSLPVH